jgi:hypothetical protein
MRLRNAYAVFRRLDVLHEGATLRILFIARVQGSLEAQRPLWHLSARVQGRWAKGRLRHIGLLHQHKNSSVFKYSDNRTPSDSELPFQFKRLQFPIRPCFAMTVSKAQGQTLQEVGIDLSTPCFCHGMLYVLQPRSGSCNSISSDACTRQNY